MAERSDSIAPNIAIVNAGGNKSFSIEKIVCPSFNVSSGKCGTGNPEGNLYKSSIVVIPLSPANFFNAQTTSVAKIIATSEPGIFFDIFGKTIITARLPAAMANEAQFICEMFWK